MSNLASQAGYGGTAAPDWNRGFYVSFHLRRISLWLRLSLDLPRDGEFIEP